MKTSLFYRLLYSSLTMLIILSQLGNPVVTIAQAMTAGKYPTRQGQMMSIESLSLTESDAASNDPQPRINALTRPCRTVNVHIDKIYINEAGDDGLDGDAEWRLDLFINGSLFEFNDDNVDTGETKPDGDTSKFEPRDHQVTLISDSSTINFQTGGYEDDDNPNDLLPSTSWSHGQGDNWGIDGQKQKYVNNLEFAYTIFYTISCISPLFADLSLTMTDNQDPVEGGAILKYNLTVTNHGPNEAQSVTLSNNLPGGLTYLSANHNGCIPSGSVISCNLGKMAKNASISVQITTRVDNATTGNLTNAATVSLSSTNEDPNMINNSTSETTTGPQTPGLPPIRACGTVNVHIDRIYINEGGDDGLDGDAEWRLDVSINGSKFEFNDDNVDTGETKPDGDTDKFSSRDHEVILSSDSSTINFQVSGSEEDDFGDDLLPSKSWSHGQEDNWGLDTQRSKYASNVEFGYTIYYTISCTSPAFYYNFLPIIIK